MRLQRMHSLSQSQAELEAILHSGGHPGADEGLKVSQPGTHPATAPYQAGAAQPAFGGLATGQPAGSAGGPPVQHEPTSPEPWALHQLPNSTQRRTNASEVLRQATQMVIGPDEDDVHPEGARDGLTAVRSLREQLDQAASHEHQGGELSCRKVACSCTEQWRPLRGLGVTTRVCAPCESSCIKLPHPGMIAMTAFKDTCKFCSCAAQCMHLEDQKVASRLCFLSLTVALWL